MYTPINEAHERKEQPLKHNSAHSTLLALATVFALTLAHDVVTAQTPDAPLRPRVYLGAGVASIQNPDALSRSFNSKFSLFGAVGLSLNPGMEVRFCGHYHDYNQSDSARAVGGPDPNLKLTQIGADLKWRLLPGPLPARPYLLAGVGSMTFNSDTQDDESDFYFNAGAGVDISLGPNFAAFAELKYAILNTSDEATGILPLLVGVRIF